METLSKQDTGYTHPYHPTAECLVFYEQGHFVGSRILWLWGKLCFGELNHYMGLLDKKESASLDLAGLCWFFCPFSPCFIFNLIFLLFLIGKGLKVSSSIASSCWIGVLIKGWGKWKESGGICRSARPEWCWPICLWLIWWFWIRSSILGQLSTSDSFFLSRYWCFSY